MLATYFGQHFIDVDISCQSEEYRFPKDTSIFLKVFQLSLILQDFVGSGTGASAPSSPSTDDIRLLVLPMNRYNPRINSPTDADPTTDALIACSFRRSVVTGEHLRLWPAN